MHTGEALEEHISEEEIQNMLLVKKRREGRINALKSVQEFCQQEIDREFLALKRCISFLERARRT